MSLEKAIQENTAAVLALISAIGTASNLHATPAVIKGAGADPVVAKQVDAAIAAARTDTEITYKMASDAVLAVNKECGRDAALKLIQSVQDGASKLPEVDAGNWGKVFAEAKKLLDAKKAGVK